MDNWASTLLPVAVLVLAFVFLVLRPARARQREFHQLQDQLEVGRKVMIASGIFGTVEAVGDETIEMRIAENTVITVNRHAVARFIAPEIDTETSTDL